MSETADLLAECEAFLRESGMLASRFGRAACGNHKLIPRMRAGKTVHLDTAAKVRRYMADWRAMNRPSRSRDPVPLSA